MKTLRAFALSLCFVVCAIAVHGQDMDKQLSELAVKLSTAIKENGKKKVAVLDFTDLQGASSEFGRLVAEELTLNLVMARKDFSVLDRANLNRVLSEHKLTATGLVDPENAKKLGQFAGVDALVIGNAVRLSQGVQLTAKVITTDTAEIVGAAKTVVRADEAIQELLSKSAEPTATWTTGKEVESSKGTSKISKTFGDRATDGFTHTDGLDFISPQHRAQDCAPEIWRFAHRLN